MIVRKLLNIYRNLQFKICGRYQFGVMNPGTQCHVEDRDFNQNHGDVVHPCVRFIDEGFLGHRWWMVYTPYYKSNAKIENPILCFGNSETTEPPTIWTFYKQVIGKHPKGYNSDPNILFDDGFMYVFWRENQTINCLEQSYSRITQGVRINASGIIEQVGTKLFSEREDLDSEVSPAFIKVGNTYKAFATSIQFFNPQIRNLAKPIRICLNKILLFIDLLGGTPIRKDYGLAIWQSRSILKPFKLTDITRFENKNSLYHPWHLDVFEWNNDIYLIIQSNQCNSDIILAKEIRENVFKIFRKPLITNKTIDKVGIYKPTALVVDGIFTLYYTAQDKDNRSLNVLYKSAVKFDDLLKQIE